MGGKHLIYHEVIPINGLDTDFTRYFLYFTDLLAIALVGYSIKQRINLPKVAIPLILWLIFQAIFIADFRIFSLYLAVRLIISLLLFVVISKLPLDKVKNIIVKGFIAFGTLESLLGLFHFFASKSLGLSLLGESPISLSTPGASSIYINGEKIIRAYGTFTHPNPLSAFLVIVNCFILYLLTKTSHKTTWWIYLSLYTVNLIGLIVTFSRAGIFAGLFALHFLVLTWLLRRFRTDKLKILFFEITTIICLLCFIPYLGPRSTISDPATHERMMLNRIAVNMIQKNGLLGLGIGNGLLHMKQYTQIDLKPWEFQPTHNYYLIAVAELGLGALAIFSLLFSTAKKIITRTKRSYYWQESSFTWNITIATIFGACLFLNLLDHYFYTLWQGQILFWTIAGLTWASSEEKSENHL